MTESRQDAPSQREDGPRIARKVAANVTAAENDAGRFLARLSRCRASCWLRRWQRDQILRRCQLERLPGDQQRVDQHSPGIDF